MSIEMNKRYYESVSLSIFEVMEYIKNVEMGGEVEGIDPLYDTYNDLSNLLIKVKSEESAQAEIDQLNWDEQWRAEKENYNISIKTK